MNEKNIHQQQQQQHITYTSVVQLKNAFRSTLKLVEYV